MRTNSDLIEVGDFIRDNADNSLRRVVDIRYWNVNDVTIYLSNGGCCGLNDVAEVLLASEVELGIIQ